jgi:hypothetical protein
VVSVSTLATLAEELRGSVSTFRLPGEDGANDGASLFDIGSLSFVGKSGSKTNGNGAGHANGHSSKEAIEL